MSDKTIAVAKVIDAHRLVVKWRDDGAGMQCACGYEVFTPDRAAASALASSNVAGRKTRKLFALHVAEQIEESP